jgi:sarcosine oxidase subunit alpha
METPLDGLFVAGNITGIESSKVAAAQGALAGLSIIRRKIKDTSEINDQILAAAENVKTVRSNASIQFHPGIVEGREKVSDAFEKQQQLTHA